MKTLLFFTFSLLALTGCASTSPTAEKRYVCQCGEDCPSCTTTSDKPGTCACGKPLVAR
jgi:hypothetical protein